MSSVVRRFGLVLAAAATVGAAAAFVGRLFGAPWGGGSRPQTWA